VIATVVDWEALLDVVVASLAVGIGVTVTFSLGILGATRFAEMRRDQRRVEEVAFGALAVAGLAITLAAVVAGIVVMTTK
jgi:hypothetical protein